MSEAGAHTSIARARAGEGAAADTGTGTGAPAPTDTGRGTPPPTEAAVRAVLADIPDPELPVLSVVDLGIIHRVEVGPDAIKVAILPTFVGCPALDVIRDLIETRLAAAFGQPVQVQPTFEVPWTSDRISAAGRVALATAGIAPPTDDGAMACPHCASSDVVMDSAFGPTQCRSLYYCRGCRQPFEAMKSV